MYENTRAFGCSPLSRARLELEFDALSRARVTFARRVWKMARCLRLACLALVALCVPRALASEAGCPLASFEARARTADVLEAAFEANGFDVQRGAMWVFSHTDIDPDCRDCSHANPSSTYGCAMLVRRGREPRRRGARFPSVERFVSGKQTTPPLTSFAPPARD